MAYRSSSTNEGGGTAPNVPVPAGAAIGDIVIIAVNQDGIDFNFTFPAGFTKMVELDITNDGETVSVGWKRLTAADAGTYTFTTAGDLDWIAQAVCFSGRHATDPPVISANASSNSNVASPITLTANGVTAVAGDDLVWIGNLDKSSGGTTAAFTPPTNFTERQDETNSWAAMSVATRDNVSAGATGTIAGTATGAPGGWAAHVVRIPSGGAAPNQGAATGAISWAGSATGASPAPGVKQGAATGAVNWVGTATGARASAGSAAGAVNWVGSASSILFPFVTDVSANGRYFLDQDGDPILIKGDSPWAVVVDQTTAQMTTYLETRASQGFNTVLFSFLGNVDNGGPNNNGNTFDGVSPFVGGDPASLNETYWTRVDHFIDTAASLGITCMAYPIDGWVADSAHSGLASAWSTATASAYGAAVGARYANRPNIIWGLGGDYESVPNTDATMDARMWAVMTGIQSAGADRIKTVQFEPDQISTEDSTFWDDKCDFNFVYSYAQTYVMQERGYLSSPNEAGNPIPALMAETHYEAYTGGPNVNDFYLREQALWALTQGSPGEFYGSENVWDQVPTSGQLATTAVGQFTAFRSFFENLNRWWDLIPDFGTTFITAGRGTKANGSGGAYTSLTDTYCGVAKTADNTLAVIYHPAATTRQITVDTSQLTAGYRVRWVDPTNGATVAESPGTTFQKTGSNAAGGADWLLVFDVVPPEGSASGAVAWSGVATGARASVGGASGSAAWAGSATGARSSAGAAAGSLALAGVATGARQPTAAAAGTVAWVGVATGAQPAVGVQDGAAAGSVAWVGVATGVRSASGAATGTTARVGSATGARTPKGAATGAVTWVGVAGIEYTPLLGTAVARITSRSANANITSSHPSADVTSTNTRAEIT